MWIFNFVDKKQKLKKNYVNFEFWIFLTENKNKEKKI